LFPDLLYELLALGIYGPVVVLIHEVGHALLARPGGLSWLPGLESRPHATINYPARLVSRRRLGASADLRFDFVSSTKFLAVERLFQFNLLVAITNLMTWRWRGSASDGWYLLDVLQGGRRGGQLLSQRRFLRRAP
jgi:hypothetical protein